MPQILNPYKAALNPKQAADGINAATSNARELLEDSNILLANHRYPRASSLSILSIEEIGKVPLIRELLLAHDNRDIRKSWIAYRSHIKKNVIWTFSSHVEEAPNIEDFRPLFDQNSDHPSQLDAVKQIGFYSDCLGNAHWGIPSEIIDDTLATSLIQTADILIPESDSAMTSESELILWVKHMKPVWKTGMTEMTRALIACYHEASELGVLRGDQTVDDMIGFLL